MIQRLLALGAVVALLAASCAAQNYDWSLVDTTIQTGMVNVTPGAVAIVGGKSGILYARAFGSFTYGIPPPFDKVNPPMTLNVRFPVLPISFRLD